MVWTRGPKYEGVTLGSSTSPLMCDEVIVNWWFVLFLQDQSILTAEVKNRPLLCHAADYGQKDIIEYLLSKGANVNVSEHIPFQAYLELLYCFTVWDLGFPTREEFTLFVLKVNVITFGRYNIHGSHGSIKPWSR